MEHVNFSHYPALIAIVGSCSLRNTAAYELMDYTPRTVTPPCLRLPFVVE